jgi:hypothetical protein
MDELKDTQDLTFNEDGSMKTDSADVEAEIKENSAIEPQVNSIEAPPDAEEVTLNVVGQQKAQDDTEQGTESAIPTETNLVEVSSIDGAETVTQPEPDTSVVVEQQVTEDTIAEPSVSTMGVTEENNKEDLFMPDEQALQTQTAPGLSNNEQSKPHEHRNNRKLAVIVTIFVALFLAGAAVFVYLSTENNAVEAPAVSPVEQVQDSEVGLPAADELEKTIDEIDGALLELNETDLSNEVFSEPASGQ